MVVVLHCVTGVTGPSGSTPLPPPENVLLGSRRIPWPGRIGVGGARAPPRGYATVYVSEGSSIVKGFFLG